jgi:UDP-N-acetylmuramate dehydrogenase
VRLPVLARRTVEAGLSGLEWMQGIPGSVGGALCMNAGGHGSDVAASLLRYRWVDLFDQDSGGESGIEQLSLRYRHSSLQPGQVVVWAEFGLDRGDTELGRAALRDIVAWRRAHQPGGSNAGSVFSNPPGDSAGRLIEAAGLKGRRLGTAAVSTKHANFIQADPGGAANDVMALIETIRAGVAERFGIELELELRTVGFGSRALLGQGSGSS